ncbi:MAG: carboxymuconolactone decarboxylase family protein [Bacteroidales bacterium]|nr:carboxymuconolactone decarboxylase family protein [Bacteroidales bacterium]
MMLSGCKQKSSSETKKDMNTLTFNTEQVACMSAIACLEAKADYMALEQAIHDGLDAGLTVNQIKEAFSHLYAYTGFPRSLNALGTLQKVLEQRKTEGKTTVEGGEASPLPKNFDALKVGTEVQTKLSGRPFNYDFCPAEDYYLKAHLFGDIFARDVLTHAERELITVSALSGMDGVEPQLKAHVNGARNMGLTDAQLQAIPAVLAAKVGKNEAIRASKAISEVLGLEDELGLKAQNAVDLKSYWPMGKPNTDYAQYFIGHSYIAPMGGDMVNVTFEPGCRNNWHIHHGMVQVLVCVYGRGWYQEWGKPAVPLTEGTVIAIPEGVKHWHGAAKDSWMQHLTYHKDVQEGTSNEWLEPVSDEVYGKLK